MLNSGIGREELLLETGLSEPEWIGHLSVLGIADADLFSEADAELIRSAASGVQSVSSGTVKEKPKAGKSKGGKLSRSSAGGSGGAIDAGKVGDALAGQLATARTAGENLADESLKTIATSYKERMAAGLVAIAGAGSNFLLQAISLDGDAEVEESVPLEQMVGEIFNL